MDKYEVLSFSVGTLKGLVSQIRAIDVSHEVWLNKLSTCIHSLQKATGKSVCNPATSNLVCIRMSNKHVYTKPRIQACFFLCIARVQRTLSYMAMSTSLQSSYATELSPPSPSTSSHIHC